MYFFHQSSSLTRFEFGLSTKQNGSKVSISWHSYVVFSLYSYSWFHQSPRSPALVTFDLFCIYRFGRPTNTPLTKESGFTTWEINGENSAGRDSLTGERNKRSAYHHKKWKNGQLIFPSSVVILTPGHSRKIHPNRHDQQTGFVNILFGVLISAHYAFLFLPSSLHPPSSILIIQGLSAIWHIVL